MTQQQLHELIREHHPDMSETEIRIISSQSSETEAVGDCATTFDAERVKLQKMIAVKSIFRRLMQFNYVMR